MTVRDRSPEVQRITTRHRTDDRGVQPAAHDAIFGFVYDGAVQRLALACVVAVAGCGRVGFGTTGDGDGGALDDGRGLLGDGSVAPSDTALPTGTGPGGLCVITSTTATGPLRAFEPRTTWNGSVVGLVWTEDPANSGPRNLRTLAPGGVLSGAVTVAVASTNGAAVIEADGASFRIAWAEEFPNSNREVLGLIGGNVVTLSTSNRTDGWPAIATVGSGTTAFAWARARGGSGYDLVMTTIDAGGGALVQEVVLASNIDTFRLDLVWTGSELVAFYVTAGQLWMRRFDTAGTALAAAISIASSSTFNGIAARWVGDRIAVAWHVLRPIRFAHVSAAGVMLTPWQVIDPLPAEPEGFEAMIDLQIARGPSSDLLVWNDGFRRIAYVQPVERSGALGQLVQWTGSQGITAVHGGDRWYIGYIVTQSQVVEMLELCP
jgi:hypothetical protein